jgi:hypothetical protein
MSEDESAISESVGVLHDFFLGATTPADALSRLAELACKGVARADLVGIATLVEGRLRTVAFSDSNLAEVDSVQYQTGIGPGVDAFRTQRVHRIESTVADRTWRVFSTLAASHGVVSILSLPLVASRGRVEPVFPDRPVQHRG